MVALLFGACGVLVARLERVQTQSLAGSAAVVDGDTLAFGADRVRLRGIDAFESGQRCRQAGADYDCGTKARSALANLTGGRRLACGGRTIDRYGRLLVVCTVGGKDVNAAMVEAGWAVAYGDYEAEERRARNAKRGAWAGTFVTPANWRLTRGGQVEERQDLARMLLDMLRQLLWGRTI